MSKTKITKEIENALFLHFFNKSYRCGLEVDCPKKKTFKGKAFYYWNGICDFVAYQKNEFTFVEIKVSKSDFKSKHGHNLVGHKNYYAVPEELVNKVIDLIPKNVGLYSWNGKKLEVVKNSRKVNPLFLNAKGYYGLTVEEILKDKIIQRNNRMIVNYIGE